MRLLALLLSAPSYQHAAPLHKPPAECLLCVAGGLEFLANVAMMSRHPSANVLRPNTSHLPISPSRPPGGATRPADGAGGLHL